MLYFASYFIQRISELFFSLISSLFSLPTRFRYSLSSRICPHSCFVLALSSLSPLPISTFIPLSTLSPSPFVPPLPLDFVSPSVPLGHDYPLRTIIRIGPAPCERRCSVHTRAKPCCCCCCCFLTLTDPLRIQPWSQDRRNQTKSNRESEMSMESIQKRTGKK